MRFRADRNGYMPDGPLGYVMEAFDQMRSSVAVQVPGVNQQPVVLDPIDWFCPATSTSSVDNFFDA